MADKCSATESVRIQLDVLFKEYEALRTEIISRTNNRFAIAGFVGAVAAFIATRTELSTSAIVVVVGVSAVILATLWIFFGVLVDKCARRLAEIEARVNELAGSRLMEWQSDNRHRPFGWSSIGPVAHLWALLRRNNRKV